MPFTGNRFGEENLFSFWANKRDINTKENCCFCCWWEQVRPPKRCNPIGIRTGGEKR